MTSTTPGPRKGRPRADERRRKSHEAIVDAASRLFREKGFAGVGVDELMRSAGLTHGGFYSHFDDKTALMVEALDAAFAEARRYMLIKETLVGDPWFAAARDRYLGRGHVGAPGGGCVIPALGAEVGRSAPAVKAAFTRGLQTTLDALEQKLASTTMTPEERRRKVLGALLTWVGAITVARAVDDDGLVDEILATAKHQTGG